MERILAQLKRHPIVSAIVVLAALLLVLSQLPGGRPWLLRTLDLAPLASSELTAEIPPEGVMLRWNALVNPWHHPSKDLTFQTELKLPLLLHNEGVGTAKVEAVRLISERQGKQIVWEALWQAEERQWDPTSPIEAQIQQHRTPLGLIKIGSHGSPQRLVLDFAPIDYPGHLPRGTYHNRLQVKLAGNEKWRNLLRFSFTIPADFALEDGSGYRYQYWQPFAVGPSL